jgi:hypothetical protein
VGVAARAAREVGWNGHGQLTHPSAAPRVSVVSQLCVRTAVHRILSYIPLPAALTDNDSCASLFCESRTAAAATVLAACLLGGCVLLCFVVRGAGEGKCLAGVHACVRACVPYFSPFWYWQCAFMRRARVRLSRVRVRAIVGGALCCSPPARSN